MTNTQRSEELFLVAEIRAVYGSNGFVSIISYSTSNKRFFDLKEVYVDIFGSKRIFFIESVQVLKERLLIKFKNFNSSEQVSFLAGAKIFISSDEVTELEENSYFVHDLIESKVFIDDEMVGIISDVVNTAAYDIYVISTNTGTEVYVPAVKEYFKSFNADLKKMELKSGSKKLFDDEI